MGSTSATISCRAELGSFGSAGGGDGGVEGQRQIIYAHRGQGKLLPLLSAPFASLSRKARNQKGAVRSPSPWADCPSRLRTAPPLRRLATWSLRRCLRNQASASPPISWPPVTLTSS